MQRFNDFHEDLSKDVGVKIQFVEVDLEAALSLATHKKSAPATAAARRIFFESQG